MRFDPVELTLPDGVLTRYRDDIKKFYGEVFAVESIDVSILGQNGLRIRSDLETSQFIPITEQWKHMQSPGYDHLGFLLLPGSGVHPPNAKTARSTGMKISERVVRRTPVVCSFEPSARTRQNVVCSAEEFAWSRSW